MNEYAYKIGDWCFFEFDLYQITEIKDGQIRGITDGTIDMGGNLTSRCVPLTLNNKRVSDFVMDEYIGTRRTAGGTNINLAEIKNEFVKYWIELCDLINTEGPRHEYSVMINVFRGFVDELRSKILELQDKEINGIKILSR